MKSIVKTEKKKFKKRQTIPIIKLEKLTEKQKEEIERGLQKTL